MNETRLDTPIKKGIVYPLWDESSSLIDRW
jgi:hypothetical protein